MSNPTERRLDQFDRHEAVDRASLMCDLLDQQLIDLRYFEHHAHLKAKLEMAFALVYEVFQAIPLDKDGRPEDDFLDLTAQP